MTKTSTLIYEMIKNFGIDHLTDVNKFVGKMKYSDFRLLYDQLIGVYEILEMMYLT